MLHNQIVVKNSLTADCAQSRLSDLLHNRVWSIHVSQRRPTSPDTPDKFVSHSVSLPLSPALSSHSLLGIRPQPQCCDGRWQLAQKGWHVIRKCAAPKMSFLIKRFWSVVNCRMLEKKWEMTCGLKYKGIIWKDNREVYSLQYVLFQFIQKKNPLKDTNSRMLTGRTFRRKCKRMGKKTEQNIPQTLSRSRKYPLWIVLSND